MQKENKPLVSEVASLAEVTGAKPSFVVVGNPEANASVKSVAASKKANVNFYWIAALDGHSEGSVLFVEDGTVAATAESGSDLSKFVSSHA
jgi:16S rRNA U516 pseudouridylate synthase RsuA-like enzyme